MFLPNTLKVGDTVGLVQPSGAISAQAFAAAKQKIEGLGFQVFHLEEMPRSYGYLGGTDAERADEINRMFANKGIDAIWCVRGGYGVQRILPLLDYDIIRNNPKPFIGFSDITALANFIARETGCVTYHGIMGVSAFSDFDKLAFRQVVAQQDYPFSLSPLPVHQQAGDELFRSFCIEEGVAIGKLVGGNLALLAAAIGTDYDIDYDGKILFLEDVGEAPYRIDRMLTQLLLAGKLDRVVGIALGIFKDCSPETNGWKKGTSLSLRDVLTDRLGALGIPVAYGFPFGHIDENACLPIGGTAVLDTAKMELTLLGCPVA